VELEGDAVEEADEAALEALVVVCFGAELGKDRFRVEVAEDLFGVP
jgi:hypothetical protein